MILWKSNSLRSYHLVLLMTQWLTLTPCLGRNHPGLIQTRCLSCLDRTCPRRTCRMLGMSAKSRRWQSWQVGRENQLMSQESSQMSLWKMTMMYRSISEWMARETQEWKIKQMSFPGFCNPLGQEPPKVRSLRFPLELVQLMALCCNLQITKLMRMTVTGNVKPTRKMLIKVKSVPLPPLGIYFIPPQTNP